jgi:hypothetical protein
VSDASEKPPAPDPDCGGYTRGGRLALAYQQGRNAELARAEKAEAIAESLRGAVRISQEDAAAASRAHADELAAMRAACDAAIARAEAAERLAAAKAGTG